MARYLWLSMQIVLILAAIGSVNLTRMTLFGKNLARPTGAAVTAGRSPAVGGGVGDAGVQRRVSLRLAP